MKSVKPSNILAETALPRVEARIARRSQVCYQRHSHDEFSFGIIDAGRARYDNHVRHHQIGVGDVVTINPADMHSCNPEQGEWSYRMLFIDAVWMGRMQQEVLGRKHMDYFGFVADFERLPDFRSLFSRLFMALMTEKDPLAAHGYLYEMIELCYARSGHTHPVLQSQGMPGYLKQAREILLDQIDQTPGLESLAHQVGVSPYHLIRTFKQYFGFSPHACLMDERIKRAKQMLKNGYKIVDTSYALGFSDQSHFQRSFKSRIALTPKQYQSFFLS